MKFYVNIIIAQQKLTVCAHAHTCLSPCYQSGYHLCIMSSTSKLYNIKSHGLDEILRNSIAEEVPVVDPMIIMAVFNRETFSAKFT